MPAAAFLQINDAEQPEYEQDFRPGQQQPSVQQVGMAKNLKASVNWNKFGTVHSMIRHGGFLASGLSGTPVEAARSFILQNRALFKLSEAGVAELEVVNEGAMPHTEARAVLFRQRFGGLRVSHDGLITVGIVSGKVYYVSSSSAGDQPLPSAATLSPLQAWLRAAADVNRVIALPDVLAQRAPRADSDWHLLQVLGFSQPQRARLVALPMPEGGVRQAYETVLVDFQPEHGILQGYVHFIDAQTGAVLRRENRVHNQAATPLGTPFQGSVTSATQCGPRHAFTAAEGTASARVIVNMVNPVNDVHVKLYQLSETGESEVADYDLLGGAEVFNYAPADGVAAGDYEVEICPLEGSTVPVFLPPFNYVGTISTTAGGAGGGGGVAAGDGLVYGTAKWRWFPSSPLQDLSSEDTRITACFGGSAAGCDEDETNVYSRQPWDMLAGLVPTFTTLGNNAFTSGSALNPVVGPSNLRLPVSPTRNYDFAFNNAWKESGCSPVNAVGTIVPAGNLNDIDATIVNLFVAHNRMHDWAYALGFTERNYNMQVSNFGQTDILVQNDPEIGAAQAGAVTGGFPLNLGRDNASQLTLQDGIPGITTQYLFQPLAGAFYAPCTDGSFDMGIVGHEYTHATTNRMIGGPDQNIGGAQGGAMGESWGDLSALEYMFGYGYREGLSEPTAMATYVSGGEGTSFRNYQAALSPLNYSNVGYDLTGPQVHADGEIWTATQWALRQALIEQWDAQYPNADLALQRRCADGAVSPEACPGNRRWIQIMYDSFLLMPASPSMLDARDAMLAADVARFGSANQETMWRAFASRGMGEMAISDGGSDGAPIPSFESPLADDEAVVSFEPVEMAGVKADVIPKARLYIGEHTARSRAVADTDPDTVDSNVFHIVPGTYTVLVEAPGYGVHRFVRTFEPGPVTLGFKLPKNHASLNAGASAITGATLPENQARVTTLIDDSETTGTPFGDTAIAGSHITVQLAGGEQSVSRVNVSAVGGPDHPGRYNALRAFEIRTCSGACTDPAADFENLAYTSAPDAFPGGKARPLQPNLTIRSFDFPAVKATHVQLRVLTSQCTGGPAYAGEQDSDPLNSTDCTESGGITDVRAAEFQVFTAGPDASAEAAKDGLVDGFRGRFGGAFGWPLLLVLMGAGLLRRHARIV